MATIEILPVKGLPELRQGDVLTKVNDQQIDQDHPLTSIMVRTRPGDKVRLTVIRGGQTQVIELTLGRQA